jgi:hypothetical protein
MKKLFTFILVSLLANQTSFTQCSETDEPKVLLVGDSWAFFMTVDGTINNVFEKWGHSDKTFYSNITIAENGAETDDFLTAAKQDEIVARLNEFPSIEVVHLSIGGNDVLGDWHISFTPQQNDSLKAVVADRLFQVIDFIKSIKPNIRVVWSGYVYPNFEEVIESAAPFQSSHPFYGTWQGMGFPTFLQINSLLNEFSTDVETFADSDPRVDFFKIPGLMQYTHGQTSPLGVAPGGSYPAYTQPMPYGDPSYPSPRTSMRDYGLTRDCFHLSPRGYFDLIEYQTRKFYHKFLMHDAYFLSENNAQTGSVSSTGNISTDLKLGESAGERFSTVLSFNTTSIADSTLSAASIFLRRESLTGNNPLSGSFEVKVINGNFGSSVNVEAADYSAVGNALGNACRFGSNGGDGHWIRLDLPVNIFHSITNDAPTQFIISTPDASGGVVTFSNSADPELAPVLDLQYGNNVFSITENVSQDLKVYPNPTTGIVTIDVKEKSVQSIDVLDLMGKNIMHVETKINTVDISFLPAGTYVMNITTTDGKLTQRVVKL